MSLSHLFSTPGHDFSSDSEHVLKSIKIAKGWAVALPTLCASVIILQINYFYFRRSATILSNLTLL